MWRQQSKPKGKLEAKRGAAEENCPSVGGQGTVSDNFINFFGMQPYFVY